MTHLLGSQYGRLVAAYNDEETLALMESAAEYILSREPELIERWDPRATVAGYRDDRVAMNALHAAVEAAGSVSLRELSIVASRAKSRLAWMQKVGKVHVIADVAYVGPAPTIEVQPEASNVPAFRAYFSTPEDLETDEQRAFYTAFKASVAAGEPLELEGNLSYGFALLNELVAQRGVTPTAFGSALELLSERDDSLGFAAQSWIADLQFLAGNFEQGFAMLAKREMDLAVYVNLAPHVGDSTLTIAMTDGWLGTNSRLSRFALARRTEFEKKLAALLAEEHEARGRSVVMDLWTRLVEGPVDPNIEEDFGGFMTLDEIVTYVDSRAHAEEQSAVHIRERRAFHGMPRHQEPVNWPGPWRSTYWFHLIVRARLKSLYRDAENILRAEAGLPLVGQGWISEVALLNELRAAFPDERIVHQGRPSWLRPQSLDIYFIDRAVGVEYQGIQHSEPVERFGGLEAFERQQVRDARKRDLCAANGLALVEVHPGYSVVDVVDQVRQSLR